MEGVVRVQKSDVCSGGMLQAGVPCSAEALVFLVDDSNPGI
jgi:hypothetical protein